MKTTTLFLSIALLVTFNSRAQNVITVDNSIGANAQFSDLQAAIEDSETMSGDIIYVHASEMNYGSITIDKPLTLIGFAHSDPDKETMITDLILGSNASNTRISGFHITGDFFVANTGVTLTNLILENNTFSSDMFFRNGGADKVIIRGNIIHRLGGGGGAIIDSSIFTNTIIVNNIISSRIFVRFHESSTVKNNIFLNASYVKNLGDSTGDLTVQNCIFLAFKSTGTYDVNRDGITFENCLSFNYSSAFVTDLVGSNNINNQDPFFVNDGGNVIYEAAIDDYHLQVGSPAIGSGVPINGVPQDMGIYDSGPFVFNNFGYTNGIPTVKITAITNSVAPDGDVEVTITTKSN